MERHEKGSSRVIVRGKSRIPEESIFFEKIIPALLLGLGILTIILIIVAAGILLGFVPFG